MTFTFDDQPIPSFDYRRLLSCSEELGRYGERFGIGKTCFGREIPCVRLGEGGPVILCVAGHHAREHLSSECLFRALLSLCRAGKFEGGRLTLYAVLSANPDGAELCNRGITSAPAEAREFLAAINGGEDFTLYKANGRGVDLNVNFPAKFGEGGGNRFSPAPQGYVGPRPLSEPENLALLSLMEAIRPEGLLTFHTKGEVIYWDFGQRGRILRRDRRIGRRLARAAGYSLRSSAGSAGGLKDFAVGCLGIPAYTVELGSDLLEHPLSYELAEGISERIGDFPLILADELEREKKHAKNTT